LALGIVREPDGDHVLKAIHLGEGHETNGMRDSEIPTRVGVFR
jgi:hypothetical protein